MSTISSGSEDRPRKRMRKGTRSCQECRRRKVRCFFQPNAQVCNGCAPRGSDCVEQELDDNRLLSQEKKKNVRDRVGELEGMIGQILHKLDAKGQQQEGLPTSNAAEALQSLQSELMPTTLGSSYGSTIHPFHTTTPTRGVLDTVTSPANNFKNAPLLSLFDNAILSHTEGEHPEVALPDQHADSRQKSKAKNALILKALKSLTPSPNDLTLVLQASQYALPFWLKALPEILDGMPRPFAEVGIDGVQAHMLQSLSSSDVMLVGRNLLCLALVMQQLPATFDYAKTKLPASQEALEDHYVRPVEALLASDEGFASSGLDAVMCMVMQSKFYLNMGKPGKAWLLNRRAMAFAQLLGAHHRQFGNPTDKQATRKRRLWLAVWQHDRIFSLILGLPYSIPEAHFNLEDIEDGTVGGPLVTNFMLRLSLVSGRIVDRNHSPRNMTFAKTLEIEQELERCKDVMHSRWWQIVPDSNMSIEDTFDMCFGKFWYHNVRKLLHLPFMLKSFTDPRYEYSKVAALESSREMIKYYRICRDVDKPIITMCDILDFEAFSAAMVLILHHLGRSPASAREPEQEDRDWEMIRELTQDMRRASKLLKCSVTTQASQMLEDFAQARYDDCDGSEDCAYEAVVPYFGKLRLRRGHKWEQRRGSVVSPAFNNQLQTPPDSISTVSDFYQEPAVSIDSYFQPLPYSDDSQGMAGMNTDWTSMINMDLRDDWSWFMNGAEPV